MPKLTEDIKLYSKLLLSVGTQGRGLTQRRPLVPVECGEYIKRLMEEENEDKVQVSTRLGLGRKENETDIYKKTDTTQVSLFLKLLDVSEKSKYFAGWGYEKAPKIAMTTICRLAPLPHHEQDVVIQSVRKEGITSQDAIKINTCRRENPDTTIEECLEKILKLKPVTEVHNFVLCTMSPKLKNFVNSDKNYHEKILNILKGVLEGVIYDIAVDGDIITIEMDDIVFDKFQYRQRQKHIPFTEFLNSLLEDRLD